jgi:hypothetical protein
MQGVQKIDSSIQFMGNGLPEGNSKVNIIRNLGFPASLMLLT